MTQLSGLDRLMRKTMKKAIPLSAHIMVTDRCNERCTHCYLPGQSKKKILALANYQKIFTQLRQAGTLLLTLSGGEPLLHPEFFAIAAQARKDAFAIRIYTNGLLINEQNTRKIRDLHPIEVCLSLYAAHASAHDSITQVPGSFQKTTSAAQTLAQAGVPVKLKTPVMHGNFKDLPQIRSLAQQIGAELQESPYLYPPGSNCANASQLCLSKENLLDFFSTKPDSHGKFRLQRDRTMDVNQHPCGAANNYVAIGCDGNVFPCPMFEQPVGNLLEESFLTIWNQAPLLQELRSLSWGDIDACLDCKLYSYCQRCVASVFASTGGLTAADQQACKIAEACAQSAGKNV